MCVYGLPKAEVHTIWVHGPTWKLNKAKTVMLLLIMMMRRRKTAVMISDDDDDTATAAAARRTCVMPVMVMPTATKTGKKVIATPSACHAPVCDPRHDYSSSVGFSSTKLGRRVGRA